MFIRHVIFLSCFLLSIPHFAYNSDQHSLQAKQWVQSYVESPSRGLLLKPYDLQLLANLCYFSYLRSEITISAQKAALAALENSWHGWQNIAHLRMNPSKDLLFAQPNHHDQQAIYNDFITAQEMHYAIGKTYAHIAHLCVKTDAASITGKAAIKELRRQSRPLVIQTFIDVKTVVDSLFDFASNQLSNSLKYDQERFNIIDSFWSNLAAYGAPPFIELEKITHQAHDTSWFVLDNLNILSACIWEAIESARSAYYQAHYYELLSVIKRHTVCEKYATILCDQYGSIDSTAIKKLPDILVKTL